MFAIGIALISWHKIDGNDVHDDAYRHHAKVVREAWYRFLFSLLSIAAKFVRDFLCDSASWEVMWMLFAGGMAYFAFFTVKDFAEPI